MAITKASTDVTANTTGTGLDVSVSHTLAAGSDRLIVVSAGYEEFQGLTNPACTYGGVSMTLLQEAVHPSKNIGSFCNGSMFFYLFEDDLPSNGSNTVTFTADNGGGSTSCYAAISVAQYNGVDDTVSPTGHTTQTANTTITNFISASAGDLVLGAVSFGQGGTGYSHNESQNEILDVELNSTAIIASTDLIATGSVTAPSSTVTTGNSVNRHVRSAAVFSPVPDPVYYRGDGTSATNDAGDGFGSSLSKADGTSGAPTAGEGFGSTLSKADGTSGGASAGEGFGSTLSRGDGTSGSATAGEGFMSTGAAPATYYRGDGTIGDATAGTGFATNINTDSIGRSRGLRLFSGGFWIYGKQETLTGPHLAKKDVNRQIPDKVIQKPDSFQATPPAPYRVSASTAALASRISEIKMKSRAIEAEVLSYHEKKAELQRKAREEAEAEKARQKALQKEMDDAVILLLGVI